MTMLLRHGFRTVGDLRKVKPSELANELDVTPAEAKEILDSALGTNMTELHQLQSRPLEKHTETTNSSVGRSNEQNQRSTDLTSSNDTGRVSSSILATGRTAQELYLEARRRRYIITFCKAIDNMLGGGIAPGEMIEFCGVPGIGKTQLGMQLAVDVQIPVAFMGLGSEAIYIDTEGSFMVERVLEMSKAVLSHLKTMVATHQRPAQVEAAKAFTEGAEMFLNGIHVMRVHDYTEQLSAVARLPGLIQANPKVRLVVIDSIAFHFRHGSSSQDFGKRTRLLAGMAQRLNELAHKQNVAVVLINQMTTKVESSRDRAGASSLIGGGHSRLVPALGESWAHAATHRVQLFWGKRMNSENDSNAFDRHSTNFGSSTATRYMDVVRYAKVIKSSRRADKIAIFNVSEKGVRDLKEKRPSKKQKIDQH